MKKFWLEVPTTGNHLYEIEADTLFKAIKKLRHVIQEKIAGFKFRMNMVEDIENITVANGVKSFDNPTDINISFQHVRVTGLHEFVIDGKTIFLTHKSYLAFRTQFIYNLDGVLGSV